MARAKQPVSINGIEFDALIDESRTLEATVPEYSVESGFSVSDAIILSPEKLDMTLFVTNTPVTWYNRHGGSQNRVDSVVKQLEELYYAGEPVTEVGYAREIPISFKKIRVTSAKTTTIPDSYGKSGATGASAGTASTSSGSSGGGSSGSGSGGSSGSSSGSSGSNGNSKSSILYSAANSMGLM